MLVNEEKAPFIHILLVVSEREVHRRVLRVWTLEEGHGPREWRNCIPSGGGN